MANQTQFSYLKIANLCQIVPKAARAQHGKRLYKMAKQTQFSSSKIADLRQIVPLIFLCDAKDRARSAENVYAKWPTKLFFYRQFVPNRPPIFSMI